MNENLEAQVKPNIEGWLRKAVEGLDILLFKGDLELDKHPYQISWGRCKGSKVIECIQPSDNEEITLDDFFPTTVSAGIEIWKQLPRNNQRNITTY